MTIYPSSLYSIPLYKATSLAFGWEGTTGILSMDIRNGMVKVAGLVVTDDHYPIFPGQYLEYDSGEACCPHWGWL